MNTVLLPVDAETERLVRRLAADTGKSIEAVIKDAIEAKATAAGVNPIAVGRLGRQELIARLEAISDHCSSLAILDPRSPDEIMGYDDNGLPS